MKRQTRHGMSKQSSTQIGNVPRRDQDKDAMKRLRRLAKDYYERNNVYALSAIGRDWLTIFGLAAFCEWLRVQVEAPLVAWIPVYLIAMIISASRFRGFENLIHEASHYNLFAQRKWNDMWADMLFGIWAFRITRDYRIGHMAHHLNLGHDDIDPDLARYADWGVLELPKNFWWVMVVRPFTGFLTLHYLTHEFKNFWKSPTWRRTKAALWLGVLVIVGITGAWTQMALYWAVPFLGILPIIRFWSVVSEHGGLDMTLDVGSSRNTLGGFLHQMIFFPHDDGYHETHHLYPGIPWYKIAQATKTLEADPYFAEYSAISHNIYATAEHMSEHELLTFGRKMRELEAENYAEAMGVSLEELRQQSLGAD